jgi:hypothetical protein
VHPDPNHREARNRSEALDELEPQAHRRAGVVEAQHDAVAERLDDLAAVRARDLARAKAELQRHVGGVVIPARQ